MPKRTKGGDAIFDALDHVLAVKRHLDSENVPAERMQMSCGDLETAAGVVPVIVQTPYPGIVQTRADAERAALVHFGAEQPWPEQQRGLLDVLQACVDAPIVYLAEAFVRVDRHGDACTVTVGTPGKPGWTNQNDFAPAVFDYLESMTESGGVLVHFADPFDRYVEPTEPETERAITWMDIYRRGVGERALALVKRPRERLILLLASHLRLSPAEINQLNLAQVTQKLGRDYRRRVYLKKRLVRKKAVAEALLHFRQRERESFLDAGEPMFRTGKTTRSGRSLRMGAKVIEAVIVRYAERALQGMPAEATAAELVARTARPPLFWIADIEYHRT